MRINQKFKPSLLSLLVASYLVLPCAVQAADCPDGTICSTVVKNDGNASYSGSNILVDSGNGLQYEGNKPFAHLYLRNNIRVSGDNASAIYLDKAASFTGNMNIEKGASVISEKGTGIKIEGRFIQGNPEKPNLGIYIKDASLVQGAENAIDFSASTDPLRIDVNGIIKGNIRGNGAEGTKINFAYQSGAKEASFDGQRISGIGKIENHGELTLAAQDKSVVWDSNFYNKNNASLIFKVNDSSDLTQPLLLVTGLSSFDVNSAVKFSYGGADINDILGKNVVLLESEGGIINPKNVTVSLEKALAKSASPILKVDDSWLVKTPASFNGGVSGDQIIARYAVNYQGAEEFVGQVAEGGATVNEIATADYIVNYALDTHNSSGSSASGELLALLATSGADAKKTAQLADELTPDAEGSELKAGLIFVDKIRAQVDERMSLMRGQSANAAANKGWNAWTQGIYSSSGQDDAATINGYSMNSYGINVGFDRVFDKQRMLGLSLAYSRSNIDVNGSSNSNEVNSFQGMIYGGWFDQRYFIDGNINIGGNGNSSDRTIGGSTGYSGDTHAKADYSTLQIGYQLMAGVKFDLGPVRFEPRVAYNYQWIRSEDYEEHGSPASLRFDRQSYGTRHLGIGYHMSETFELSKGLFTPSMSIMGYKDMNSEEVFRESATLTAMDISADRFIVTGDKVGGDMVEIKLNGHLAMENNFSIAAGLNYYQRDKFSELAAGISTIKRF